MIKNSKYEIKIVYDGEIEHQVIDMKSKLDFLINYDDNFDALLMEDQILSDDRAKFMFAEVFFNAPESGKIVEVLDMDTNNALIQYSSKQSLMYIPSLFIGDSKLWLSVRFNKNTFAIGCNQENNSIQCRVRIISDAAIRLFPDDSQRIQFEQIKKLRTVVVV